MKLIRFIILILIAAGVWSCEDYLDLAPDNQLDEAAVFSTYESARGYLDHCLVLLHTNPLGQGVQGGVGSGNFYACITDEGAANSTALAGEFNSGEWFGRNDINDVGGSNADLGTPKGFILPNALYGLRIANKTLEKVPEMSNLTTEQANELLGQAHFFRAWFYFEVIRRWGGMPLFDKAFDTDDEYDLPRLSYQESTDWMLEDIEAAIQLLPHKWSEDQVGRPDKAAAYAIRGWVTLYAASPLMNNPVGTIANNGYNQEYLKKAAKYCYEAIEYVRSQGRDMAGLDLTDPDEIAANYQNIFYHNKATGQLISQDALFYANSTGQDRDGVNNNLGINADISRMFMNKRFSYRGGGFGVNFSSPTQNAVDKYEVINPVDGKAYPYDHPNSGFSWSDPFANRDPRFYNNILIPGGQRSIPNGGPHWFEPWVGGADYAAPGQLNEAVGGYMCIKWWWNNYTKTTSGTHCYNYAFIRTSQLYLDYAEAMNEITGVGPTGTMDGCPMTAVEAINLVRQRAGMVAVNDEFTVDAPSFRNRIRNERSVELFWEGHRWFDIRRWMIFDEVFPTLTPIRILRTTDATDYAALGITNVKNRVNVPGWEKTLTYTVEVCSYETRSFSVRNYWYPIFKDHMDRLSVMKQNPGW